MGRLTRVLRALAVPLLVASLVAGCPRSRPRGETFRCAYLTDGDGGTAVNPWTSCEPCHYFADVELRALALVASIGLTSYVVQAPDGRQAFVEAGQRLGNEALIVAPATLVGGCLRVVVDGGTPVCGVPGSVELLAK